MRQQRGYIAGPMRGYPELNFPAFDRAARWGKALGYDIISPADLDRGSGIHEKDAAQVEAAVKADAGLLRAFVERDVSALLSLRAEDGDFLALLPGWTQSVGAMAEYHVARWLKLDIRDAETFHPLDVQLDGKFRQIVRLPLLDTSRCVGGFCDV